MKRQTNDTYYKNVSLNNMATSKSTEIRKSLDQIVSIPIVFKF